MLSIERLTKSYNRGEPAVRDLSFNLPAGAIVSLLGHNGAGKTTTLKVVAGILAPSAGTVVIEGKRLDARADELDRECRRRIGFLPENGYLLDYMTPREFLWYVGHLYGFEDEDALRLRITTLVDAFSVERAESCLLKELSAGQRRRVSIVAALLNEPRLLLLDEPTNFLDPIGVKILKEYLLATRAKGNAALLATHRLDVAEQLSDAVIVLDHGRTVFQGTLRDLSEHLGSRVENRSLEELYTALVGN
jgi:ABC-type multidrug transport system ATPase subunit